MGLRVPAPGCAAGVAVEQQVLRRMIQGPGTVSAIHGEAPLIRRDCGCLVVAGSQGVGQRVEPVDDQGIEQRLPARKVVVHGGRRHAQVPGDCAQGDLDWAAVGELATGRRLDVVDRLLPAAITPARTRLRGSRLDHQLSVEGVLSTVKFLPACHCDFGADRLETRQAAVLCSHLVLAPDPGAIALAFFGLFGFIFLITQYFQVVRGYDPLQAGVATLPFAVVTGAMSPVAIGVMKRIGPMRVRPNSREVSRTGEKAADATEVSAGWRSAWAS